MAWQRTTWLGVWLAAVVGCSAPGGRSDGGVPAADGGSSNDAGADAGPTDAGAGGGDAGRADAGLDDGGCLRPGNLVRNGDFDCAAGPLEGWVAAIGELSAPADVDGGRLARLLVVDAGATLIQQAPFVREGGAATYCVSVRVRGTVPYAQLVVLKSMTALAFSAPVTPDWTDVPLEPLRVSNDFEPTLTVSVQAAVRRLDGNDARPGQVLDVDDVVAFRSPDGGCLP